jgi:hypothetical protein
VVGEQPKALQAVAELKAILLPDGGWSVPFQLKASLEGRCRWR